MGRLKMPSDWITAFSSKGHYISSEGEITKLKKENKNTLSQIIGLPTD